MTKTYDVAILGGGHNGLVCAFYLARRGLDVVVVEKNAHVGGAALTEEFHPGYRNSVASYTVSLLNPKIIREMDLHGHGLEILERPVANFWPIDPTSGLVMPYGLAPRQKAIAAFSTHDAEALPRYDADLERAATFLRHLLLQTPPNVGGGIMEFVRNIPLGRRIMGLSVDDQRLLLDLFTRSAAEFLERYFKSDIVKAAFAFDGIVGAYASPYTPGTAYVLLHHCFGEVNGKSGVWGHAKGGMGAITQAMARAAAGVGATIRTSAPVAMVRTTETRATGLVLATGEEIRANVVAANIPPKLLFRAYLGADAVDENTRAHFTGMTTGSGTFRMNVALSELPDFLSHPGTMAQPHHGAGIVIGPTLDYLDQAYMDARRDGWSREPIVELLIPTTLDPDLAPKGHHVASLFVQHVAPRLPEPRSWTDPHEKARFADRVIETVGRYAPNFPRSIVGRQVLSPLDLEQRFGLVDGDIFHGQLSLAQLFSARPVLGYGAYRLPVEGLFLCGSGAHPGGGVTGVPGHNAAREILKDFSTRHPRRWHKT